MFSNSIRNRRVRGFLEAAAFALFSMLFVHRGHAGDVEPAGKISVAINADIRSTNPGVNRDANTDAVVMHIFEGLVAYREDASIGPMLAETVDVSPDLTTYTFKLRRGVRFQNGAALTSSDVAWSWKRYLDPKTKWLCLSEFDGTKGLKIESVEASDPQTVVFRLNRPRPLFLTEITSFLCGGGAIVHKDSVQADGSWKWPIGTGPYMLREWKHGQYIELAAFRGYSSRDGPRDGYTGGKIAYADTVRWIVIKDEASRRNALIKGQIDILPGLKPSEFEEMGSPSNAQVTNAPSMSVNALLIQTRDPLLANPLLRRALAHSLDMASIVRYASGNAGVANASMVPAASSFYSPAQKQAYGYDLEKARRLVAQSGYKGQPIKMLTDRRYPDVYDQSMMIQGMARKAGINIEMEVLEWATQLDRYQAGNYQLMSFTYSSRADPYLSYDGIIGDKRVSKRKVWDDPKAIALLSQLAVTGDRAERQSLFDQLHSLMLEDVPLIVLFNPGDSHGVSKKITGFAPWSQNRERLWGVRRAGE